MKTWYVACVGALLLAAPAVRAAEAGPSHKALADLKESLRQAQAELVEKADAAARAQAVCIQTELEAAQQAEAVQTLTAKVVALSQELRALQLARKVAKVTEEKKGKPCKECKKPTADDASAKCDAILKQLQLIEQRLGALESRLPIPVPPQTTPPVPMPYYPPNGPPSYYVPLTPAAPGQTTPVTPGPGAI
jgi:hypothetical protein